MTENAIEKFGNFLRGESTEKKPRAYNATPMSEPLRSER